MDAKNWRNTMPKLRAHGVSVCSQSFVAYFNFGTQAVWLFRKYQNMQELLSDTFPAAFLPQKMQL